MTKPRAAMAAGTLIVAMFAVAASWTPPTVDANAGFTAQLPADAAVTAEVMVYGEEDALLYALGRPGFAGWFFDSELGVVFQYTTSQPDVAGRFSDPSLVRVRQVTHDLEHLERLMAQVQSLAIIGEMGGAIESISVSEPRNAVTVGLSINSSADIAAIKAAMLAELPTGSYAALDIVESAPLVFQLD